MSKYSTELRYIVESNFDLGMKDYEIFSENYREKLNKKIIDHYYFHEIGFETVSRFKHYLNSTLNEIMPFYNKLLESELIEINPLITFERRTSSNKGVDTTMTEDIENLTSKIGEVKGSQNITTSTSMESETSSAGVDKTVGENTKNKNSMNLSNANEQDVFFDTPSGSLGNITDENYATNISKKGSDSSNDLTEEETGSEEITSNSTVDTNTSSSSSGSSSSSSADDISEETSGKTDISKIGNIQESNIITEDGFEIPLSDLLIKYRSTFLNIDKQIIDELKNLFMMVY